MNEYWEVEFVQYRPNAEAVLIGGYHKITATGGKLLTEWSNVNTTQTELLAHCPEGVTVWGDEEVAQIVTEVVGIPCVFPEEAAPEVQEEPNPPA